MTPVNRRLTERRLTAYLEERDRPMATTTRRQLDALIREPAGRLNAVPREE